jgi:hypothetical protein
MNEEQELLKALSEMVLSLAYDGEWTDAGTLVITLNKEKAMAFRDVVLTLVPAAERHARENDEVMRIRMNLN